MIQIIWSVPEPGLFTDFGCRREEARDFSGLTTYVGIFLLHTDGRGKMHKSFASRPPRPVKEAGREEDGGRCVQDDNHG